MKAAQNVLCTDKLLETMYTKMSNDLSPYLPEGHGEKFKRGSVHGLAKYSDPWVFRAKYQLDTFFKRYICKQELGNAKQLEREAFAKFLTTQKALKSGRPSSETAFRVVQAARREIRRILGEYSVGEHTKFCRFGKRAAVGLPFRTSYLDVRVRRLTGSKEHTMWFEEEVLSTDSLLRRVVKGSFYSEPSSLELSSVPKAWDKKRTILKNTVLGGFYSAGLGDYMVELLKANTYEKLKGYHLSRRPDVHRAVIRKYSRTLCHVTADLSAASDSFSWWLMNMLFPRSWYNAMKFGQIRDVNVKGFGTIQIQSFMTMGMGFTFPAQTIAFLALLRAIKDLLGLKRGRVSVFGDDLIYPREMHPYVVAIFAEIGFTINKDKTFVTTPFRESCGADYYDGIDVRPYQPEGQHEELRGLRALSHLYKIYNGLATRWLEVELPDTFDYLRTEMLRFTRYLHQVPSDFPDTSGIRSDVVCTREPYMQPIENDNGTLCFESLSFKFRLRQVPLQLPYLWENLRGGARVEDYEYDPWAKVEDSTTLIWATRKRKIKLWRSSPIWVDVLVPHVAEKGSRPAIERRVSCSIMLRSTED